MRSTFAGGFETFVRVDAGDSAESERAKAWLFALMDDLNGPGGVTAARLDGLRRELMRLPPIELGLTAGVAMKSCQGLVEMAREGQIAINQAAMVAGTLFVGLCADVANAQGHLMTLAVATKMLPGPAAGKPV